MRIADVFVHEHLAGRLVEEEPLRAYAFTYATGYDGPPVSLTMPVRAEPYRFDRFPPFFDGLLPEGYQLEALLRQAKLDRHDRMGQLLVVGGDTVGAVTVQPAAEPAESTP
jgi:serine/threonine-protein kinase HipA